MKPLNESLSLIVMRLSLRKRKARDNLDPSADELCSLASNSQRFGDRKRYQLRELALEPVVTHRHCFTRSVERRHSWPCWQADEDNLIK
jgi:hypothetical protein